MRKLLLTFIPLIFLYFYNLGLNDVWIYNESFYADGAKNMLKTGDYLTPVYNGEIRLNKPPLTYWLGVFGFKIFGINELGLRFFIAVLGILTGFLTYLLAKRLLKNEDTALLSAVILNLSFIFVANARYASPEVPLTFFTTLSLVLWFLYYESKKLFYFYLALLASVFGVLTKGPVGFLMPAGIIFIYLLLHDPKELIKLRYYAGTLFVVLSSGWWFLYQYFTNREEFLKVFIKENIKRIYGLQQDPVYQYLLDVNVSFLPYSFLIFPAVFFAFRKKELRFPLVWFLTIFITFSLIKMKIPVYIMPAYPAMAILTAHFLQENFLERFKKISLIFLGFLLITATAVVGVLYKFSLLLIPLLLLGLVPVFLKKLVYFPALAGFSFLLYLSAVVLPFVEQFRPYDEIGRFIKSLDPQGNLRTYEVWHFHHNLPFYADRVIIRNKKPSEVKPPAIVLFKEGSMNCEPLKGWKLYTSSESRFFKFLMDIKRGKRFARFGLCKVDLQ
ncbi:ArnT family glycosyltransferase [Aquifex sp.]